jgi:oligopeptide transport system substrate-binding protein
MALAVLALLGAACQRRETLAAEGIRRGVLLVGNGGEVQTLDPQLAGGLIDHNPVSALFEGLVTLDETTLEPRPGLARSWDISADGLTYTFHLQPGLKWSNGVPLTTADFLYSFARALSPALASEYNDVYFPVVNAQAYARGQIRDFGQVGFEAPDRSTLVMHLRRRTHYFLTLLRNNCWYPVYRPAIEQGGARDDRSNAWTRRPPLVSCGPFRLVSWRDGQDITLEKNPYYWDAAHVRLNGIRFFSNESLQGQELAFRAGQLHVTWSLPISKVAAYRERDILNGGQTAATSFVPPGIAGYVPPALVHMDVERARALLAEAGFPGGRGFPSVDYLTIAAETDKLIAEALQQMWRKNLGVEVGISQQEFKTYLQSINNTTLNYSLARGRLEIMQGSNGINGTGFSSRTYDSLLEAADRQPDAPDRLAGLARAETYLLQQSPVAPVYFGTSAFLVHPAVHGWNRTPLGFHNYKNVWLEP